MLQRNRRSTRNKTILIDINAASLGESSIPERLPDLYTSNIKNNAIKHVDQYATVDNNINLDKNNKSAVINFNVNQSCLQKENINENITQAENNTNILHEKEIPRTKRSVKDLINFYNNFENNDKSYLTKVCNNKNTTKDYDKKCTATNALNTLNSKTNIFDNQSRIIKNDATNLNNGLSQVDKINEILHHAVNLDGVFVCTVERKSGKKIKIKGSCPFLIKVGHSQSQSST